MCSSKWPGLQSLFIDTKVLLAFGTCQQGFSGSNFPSKIPYTSTEVILSQILIRTWLFYPVQKYTTNTIQIKKYITKI